MGNINNVSCIIIDGAGTAIDFGYFAPLHAFLKVCAEEKNIHLTCRQACEPMGLPKLDPIRTILQMLQVDQQFKALSFRGWNAEDVDEMYGSFEKHLFATLQAFTTPIAGVVDTLDRLRVQGIKISFTTSYTQAMMEVGRLEATRKGYRVDNLVTPGGLPAGRPAPYMIYKNMIDLAIPSIEQVVKEGDTLAISGKGGNVCIWMVGIVMGSNELGWAEEEYRTFSPAQLIDLKKRGA